MPDPALSVSLRQDSPIPLDVALACAPGELLALVGPSGSGKSTVLRCIAGLHRPAMGRILCGGETWFDDDARIDRPAHRRRVGFVFQNYALFPHMTALENVTAAMQGVSRAERDARGRAILERVHLGGLEERRPAALSGGQQQRVAVARALARDPAVLLLDEPFSAVDRATRKRLYRELAELHGTLGMPVVLVTHDLEEAALLSDRLCILHRGRTLQEGPPLEVMARPASPDVARLIDIRNIFEGRVLEHRETCTLVAWRGHVLEAAPRADVAAGSVVPWCIPASGVLLHRRDRPSRGERENPVAGRVAEFVPLGENASMVVLADGSPDAPLALSVPVHVAHRNAVSVGVEVTVSLLADSIHLMPRI
ncbi:ABC transporter ATP-binding protein [Arenibaculum pallidiluteum]|uniref:ABC transporter ATP-binding protein n=1 Tax=Arenibaculum pallidiluteum TaxID=2812559 RepID=UPI001A96DD82|nr:ABC transporter ATP-binding protein [Arenibaculum pallidiluteum]